ncbi:MAG: GAF domain-containing protein, partial [Anaerolineales bacterium]
SELFDFYHVAIYLFDEERRNAFLQAASSEDGKRMMEKGFHIANNSKNVVGYVSEQNKSYIITNAEDTNPDRLISEGKLDLTQSELVIPLTVRGTITGIMDFQSKESRDFNQDEIEILQSLADQIAISMNSVQLINDTQAFVSELESLTVQQTKDVWKHYLENRGIAYQYTPSGTKLINPRQSTVKTQTGMQVPLRLRGQNIGMLTFQGKEKARWTERERDVAEKVAAQVALALDNSRLLEETRQRAIQQQTVNEISSRLNRSLDIDVLLQTAARELGNLPEVAEVSVILGSIDENKQAPK